MDRQKQTFTKILISLTTVFILVCVQMAKAQNDVMPAQVTLVTPLGTNGLSSSQTMNHFSLNLLWGNSAGVIGAELGGVLNITNGPVVGLQTAGLANIASGKLIGTQLAGLINTSSSSLKGVQAAGLINIASSGDQELDHVFPNARFATGTQLSGLVNINESNLKGVQASGLVNIETRDLNGIQMAGLMNSARNVKGVQASGLVNKATNVSGLQLGIINIADTIKSGVPVGLINIVKDGYSAIEVESNESFYANVNYKLGIERFYTIFSVAYRAQNGNNFWAPGIGFGTFFPLGQRTAMNIDLISYQVNEDEWWTNQLNQLNKLKINGSFALAEHLSIYGGISINVRTTEIKNEDGKPDGSIFDTPHAFFDETHRNTRVLIYPGINAGIRF